ncbi:hypothetical protein O181_121707 [Austropuccinia psidii MF-1]|uniref:Uncharacterized protein n=1 Tax=Austropuccinia psidii MF-1 TaxID=1389203 RepID=A0A9Q3Q3N9_9BASI|nr:hypothetical protein [Austropuccinia psidii MF-1]
MSQQMVHMKIHKNCGGKLKHSLRSRCIEPRSTKEYINALEDIVISTKIGRTWKKLDIKSPNKPFIMKDKPRETLKPNTSNNNGKRKDNKCEGIGHLANNCLKKAKINEIMETEDLSQGLFEGKEGLELSKMGLTYGGLKDMVRKDTLKSVKDELLK